MADKPTMGGPETPAPPVGAKVMSTANYPATTSGDYYRKGFNIRDILASFVGRGDTNLSNEQARKDYSYLTGVIGAPMAQKVLTHLIAFNQRPDQQKKPFESRLQSMYDIGSNDKDVDAILHSAKMLEYGPVAGARSSANVNVMSAAGIPNATTQTAPATAVMANKKAS